MLQADPPKPRGKKPLPSEPIPVAAAEVAEVAKVD
jgi:hypothetical protein